MAPATEDNDSANVNASSETQTQASSSNTRGTLNQHPDNTYPAKADTSGISSALAGPDGKLPFRIGIAEDRNKRWRRTMEDAHAFVYDYGGVRGQGFFGIFDGHAGKHAAEWCGQHFHNYLLDSLVANPKDSVPDIFNKTYHAADEQLSQLADKLGTSSGCTTVTVLLRLETKDGRPAAYSETGGAHPNSKSSTASESSSPKSPMSSSSNSIFSSLAKRMQSSSDSATANTSSSSSKDAEKSKTLQDDKDRGAESGGTDAVGSNVCKDGLVEVSGESVRRVLYTANVGDARAVLCRGGKAVRLTYDHKGSDAQEAKRIMDAGGFVMNNRVNGVLAVTRSLGDSAMKEFVVGSPYTTELTLSDEDTFLIVACDGLWDVTDDQDAVDLVRDEKDPQAAAARLLQHALSNFSTDNTSVMVVRFACEADVGKASAQSLSNSAGDAQRTSNAKTDASTDGDDTSDE